MDDSGSGRQMVKWMKMEIWGECLGTRKFGATWGPGRNVGTRVR